MIIRKFSQELKQNGKVNSDRIHCVTVNSSGPQTISMPSTFSLSSVFAYLPDEKTEGKVNIKRHAQDSTWWAGLFIPVGFSSYHSVQ